MAALIEKSIIQLCMRDRLTLTVTFTRGKRYSQNFIKNDIIQKDIEKEVKMWQDGFRQKQPVIAAQTDESTFSNYNERVLHFQNSIMEHGKKGLARDLTYKAFEKVKRIQLDKYHKAKADEKKYIVINPYEIFYQATENGRPVLHTRKIWKSGITYDVPEACTPNRQLYYSMKWLGEAGMSKDRRVRFYDKLAEEIINLYHNRGYVIKKKQELHRRCESNKAYAQIKWKR